MKKGETKGISLDYLKQISERTGINFEFIVETRSFAESLDSSTKRRGLGLASMEERARLIIGRGRKQPMWASVLL